MGIDDGIDDRIDNVIDDVIDDRIVVDQLTPLPHGFHAFLLLRVLFGVFCVALTQQGLGPCFKDKGSRLCVRPCFQRPAPHSRQ
jgi:hypothetical protein